MQTSRRFQIASSLARILRRQFGINDQIAEGHFPSQHNRGQYVSIARDGCHLVLTDAVGGANAEQRTEIPRVQAEALLEVSPQRIAYGRTELQRVGQGRVWADFFVKPGSFDLLSVVFDDEQTAAAFVPPPWFSPEVTSNPAFGKRSIALAGLPSIGEPISVSDSALHHLLNMIEGRRPQAPERHSERASPGSLTLPAVSAPELPNVGAEEATRDPIQDGVVEAAEALAASAPEPAPKPAA